MSCDSPRASPHAAHMTIPPSTTSTCPVMYDAHVRRQKRDQRPRCRSACRAARAGSARTASSCASSVIAAVMSVSMKPGATTLARMLRDAELLGDRLGEADQPRLARRVVRLPLVADDADDAGDVDDPSPAPLHHAARRRANRDERAAQVGVDHGVPVVVLDAEQDVVARQPGVVDEDVDLRRTPSPPPRRAPSTDAVSPTSHAKPARRRRDRRRGLLRARLVAPDDRDARARAGQRLGDRAADAARAAGDERRACPVRSIFMRCSRSGELTQLFDFGGGAARRPS